MRKPKRTVGKERFVCISCGYWFYEDDMVGSQCAECAGLGSGRCVKDDFIAVVDGYWFRDCISDWKERRGTVYDFFAGVNRRTVGVLDDPNK